MRSGCFALFLAAVFFCIAALPLHGGGFGKISKHLDPDGIEYSVMSAASWQRASKQLDKMLNDMVWQNELSAVQQRRLLRAITIYRFFRDASGLDKASGFGCSSALSDADYIHNRAFLAIDTTAEGFVNEFLGENDLELKKFLAKLPETALFAVSANLVPETLLELVRKCGGLGLLEHIPAALPLPEFCRQSAGNWQLILARDGNELIWQLELPDKEGRWFTIALFISKERDAAAGRAVLDLENGKYQPVVVKKEQRMVVYSSAKAEKHFTTVPAMKLPDKYASALLKRMPEKGTVLFFCSYAGDELGSNKLGSLNIRTAPQLPSVGVLSRESDGWLYTENSDHSVFFGEMMNTLSLAPYLAMLSEIDLLGKDEPEKNAFDRRESRKGEVEPVREDCSCRKELSIAKRQLNDKSGVEAGFYRITRRKNGLRQLSSCGKADAGMVIFSKVESRKTVPLAVCVPHDNHFCVLFSNGEIRCFKLAEAGSYRRIVGYLHTLYMYDETVFGKLMKDAAVFDEK